MGAYGVFDRHVRGQGLGLVVVNYWEWKVEWETTPEAQEALVKSKIDAVLQRRSP